MANGKPGAPRKFTPEQWREKVEAYYKSITYDEPIYKLEETGSFNAKGKPIYDRVPLMVEKDGQMVQATKKSFLVPPTVLALCLSIGINKDTFEEYKKADDYKDVCKWWLMVCEAYNAELLTTKEGNVQGVLFNLKVNYGWQDEQKIAVSGVGIEKYLDSLSDSGSGGQKL